MLKTLNINVIREMILAEGITPLLSSEIIKRCKEADVRTVLDFITFDPETLAKKISTPYKDVFSIQKLLLACHSSFPQSGDHLYEEQLQVLSILSTGSKGLDEFLEGGVYTGEITEVHGSSGVGKTQLCLSILSCLLLETENTAIYLDTNGSFTSKRLEQILFSKSKDKQLTANCLKKVRVFNVHDIYEVFDVLYHMKSYLYKEADAFYSCLKLVIFDSVTPVVSPYLGGLQFEGHGLMTMLAQQLKLLCSEHSLSLFMCNNMVQGENAGTKPALGRSWEYVPSVTLCISRNKKPFCKNSRMLSLKKSCRRDTFGNVEIAISDEGVTAIATS